LAAAKARPRLGLSTSLYPLGLQPFLPHRFVSLFLLWRLLPTSLPYHPLPSTPYVTYAWLACSLPYTWQYCLTVWFIYGPSEGRTVHFTDYKQDLLPAQSTVWKTTKRHFWRDSLRIFCILWFYFLCISFVFYSFIKANYRGYTQAVLFLSTASV